MLIDKYHQSDSALLFQINGVNIVAGTSRIFEGRSGSEAEIFLVLKLNERIHNVAVCAKQKCWLFVNYTIISSQVSGVIDGRRLGVEQQGTLQVDKRGNILANMYDGEVVCALYDDGVSLWSGTVSGKVFRYDGKKEQATSVHYTGSGEAAHQVSCILKDWAGIVWISTLGGGAYKLTPKHIEFVLHQHKNGRQAQPSQRAIWSIAEFSDHSIWLGTGRGLAVLGKKGVYADAPGSTLGYPVRAILEENDIVNIGMLENGLVRWKRSTNTWKHYMHTDSTRNITTMNIYSIMRDRGGSLWLGTNNSPGLLEAFDPASGAFAAFGVERWDRWTLSLWEDRKGRLWVGTWASGIAEFNRPDGTFIFYAAHPSSDMLHATDRISVIHESARETDVLWLGTLEGGLLRFDSAKKEFTSYTENDGLASNAIYGILEDDFGNLWMSTNKGISRFDPRTKAFTNFDVNSGLQGNEFNLGAYLKASDGTLYFGGDNGLNSFKPGVDVNPVPPRVFVTRVSVFGAPIKHEMPLSEMGGIELDYNRNQVTFSFVGLHCGDPARNRYACMLEGYDTVWNNIGTKREASYANLQPQDYAFKVRAANSDGVWSEPVSISLHIGLPIWKQKWLYAVLTLVIVGSIYGVYRYKVTIEVQRALDLERVQKEVEGRARQRLQRSVHDQLAGQAANVARKVQDLMDTPVSRIEGLQEIEESVNMLINQLRNLNWQIDPTKDSLFDLLAQLKQYGENLFLRTTINFVLVGVKEEFQSIKLPPEWREELLLLFEEAMNNVAKHAAGCTTAGLTVHYDDGFLQVTLSDNGIGFSEVHSEKKNGLLHMQERGVALGGDVTIRSNGGTGTRVSFKGKLPRGGV